MKDPDAELKLALESAAKLGFIVVQKRYYEEHFGNLIIEMRNADMRLRFVQDRGELYCDAGSHSDPQWYPQISS